MKPGRVILLVVLIAAGVWMGVRAWRHRHASSAKSDAPPIYQDSAYDTRAPAGVRIKVEVLNATTVQGLGRRATDYLRDRGFDVVTVGTTKERYTQSVVIDHSNHPQWAALLARAMRGRVMSRPDTSRYLDATVLVGSAWTPPPLPFYP